MRTAWIVAVLLLAVVASGAYAQNTSTPMRYGLGIGGNTGGAGLMAETQSQSAFALTSSTGVGISGFAWETGAHLYLTPQTKATHKGVRATVQYGSTIYLSSFASSDATDLGSKKSTGWQVGVGYQGIHWNADVILPLTGRPEGYKNYPLLGLGYMF